jgi:glutathione S-transferase
MVDRSSLESLRIRLVGPAMAPPVELQRWLYLRHAVPHRFIRRAAGLHAFASLRRRQPIELPLILTRKGPVGGLRPSLAWLDSVLPKDERLFRDAESRAFIEAMCTTLFAPAVKSFYFHMLEAPSVLIPAAIAHTPLRDRLFVRLLRPVWRWMMRRGLDLDQYRPAEAEAAIDRAFALVEEQLAAGGGPFLDGGRPGHRDIVFAVLASPVILPRGHPAELPPDEALPPALRTLVDRCRARPGGLHAQRVYETRSA